MKRIFLLLLIIVSVVNRTFACAESWDSPYNEGYYNLFMQEVINDPQYYPFLLSLYSAYYPSHSEIKNENIEEWAEYLGLKYDDALYLVFKASESDVNLLLDKGKSKNDTLKFVTPGFIKKFRPALEYISYAKYMEPYMAIASSGDGWWYYSGDYKTANQLNYTEVTLHLQKNWKATKDKELKLRYGYQLVRFAHYNHRYEEAVQMFDTYVEPLNYKPAMYYHALSQKAGAERGLGEIMSANYNFFQVFAHSKNLKETALTSLKFSEEIPVKDFLDKAKTDSERNDAYLLLGYFAFSNPLNEIEKIIKTTPDAIQAKVLMARAVNTIERKLMNPYISGRIEVSLQDKRYPLITDSKMSTYFRNVMALSEKMVDSETVKDKNFWYLTTAYLHFMNKDFTKAKDFLSKVKSSDKLYESQKNSLAMYIDICEQPVIDNEAEIYLYSKYKKVIRSRPVYDYEFSREQFLNYDSQSFVTDVLANRYYLQKEYAKSFLLHHDITAISNNPNLDLLSEIEVFYKKSDKNDLEKMIVSNMSPADDPKLNIQSYIDRVRGMVYLTAGELGKSLDSFSKIPDNLQKTISGKIFGYNKIECFECEESNVMMANYFSDFPYIKGTMTEKELVEALIKLTDAGQQSGDVAARANYLAGSFYYNTTRTGYFRHLLRFDNNNLNCSKFYNYDKKEDIFNSKKIYLKSYNMYYDNNISGSQAYLLKAYNQATDSELKARIAFALSKCEQEEYYDKNDVNYYYRYGNNKDDGILISKRKYFKELAQYKNTKFYKEVATYCKYFDYYITNCM